MYFVSSGVGDAPAVPVEHGDDGPLDFVQVATCVVGDELIHLSGLVVGDVLHRRSYGPLQCRLVDLERYRPLAMLDLCYITMQI